MPTPRRVARALAARPDVEYAQASYLRQPLFVPNDPYFAQQWNLAILDMARAWDINAGASDAVVVAVIDTGVAFTDLDVDFEARAFRVGETRYPALGAITLPFAAAPDLAGPGPLRGPVPTSSGATSIPWTSTATAPTSRARSASSRTTGSAWPAWRSTSGSCRSR